MITGTGSENIKFFVFAGETAKLVFENLLLDSLSTSSLTMMQIKYTAYTNITLKAWTISSLTFSSANSF